MLIPNSKQKLHMHNYFVATLRDARTGKVKQVAKAQNVVLNRFYTANVARNIFRYLQVGTGTGLPRATDTSLFNRKYTLYSDSPTYTVLNSSTVQVTTNVTSALGNTGAFTEVGFGDTLITHALFTDSEDNPIVINQTNTDILEITAVAYLTISTTDNVMTYPVYGSTLLRTLLTEGSYNYNLVPTNVALGLATSISRVDTTPAAPYIAFNGVSFGLANYTGDYGGSATTKNTTVRIGVSTGNRGFYNYVLMGFPTFYAGYGYIPTYPFCYVKFPNATLFPLYAISGIPVGTGTGTKTQFDCPFDMFVPNSDAVYVDGVQKTRGVDYTIDSRSNHSGAIGITPGAIASFSTQAAALTTNYTRFKFFSPSIQITGLSNEAIFTQANPLLITLDDTDTTIGTTLNFLKLANLRTPLSSANNSMTNAVFTLSYSNDGTVYTDATTITITGSFGTTYTSQFTAITAKYWKLSVDLTSCALYTGGTYTANTPILQVEGGSTVLGYAGTGITFTTAPANGSVVTMNLSIDRPYKSSNYVIDIAGNYTISN